MNIASLIFFQKPNKQPPFFSKFYIIYKIEPKQMKTLSGYVNNLSLKKILQYNVDQNKQPLYMSDLELKPMHKFFRVTISSNKNTKIQIQT